MAPRGSLRTNAPFLLVLALLAASLLYLVFAPGHWRRGTVVLAGALFVAGLARACLPSSAVGLLAVRARWFDTVAYLLLCGVMLAVTIRLHR